MLRLLSSIALQGLALFLAWMASPLTFILAGMASILVLFLRPKTNISLGG